MSTEQTQMTGEQARDLLMAQVFAPIFFDKLAKAGRTFHTDDEARVALRIADRLLVADALDREKAAGVNLSFLQQAEADLQREMANRYGPAAQPAAADGPPPLPDYLKEAGTIWATDPQIHAAIDAFNAAIS